MAKNTDDILTTAEVAGMMRRCERQIHRYKDFEGLPYSYIKNGSVLAFSLKAVLGWITARQTGLSAASIRRMHVDRLTKWRKEQRHVKRGFVEEY